MTLKPGWLKEQVEEVMLLNGHWCYQHGEACVHVKDLRKAITKKRIKERKK